MIIIYILLMAIVEGIVVISIAFYISHYNFTRDKKYTKMKFKEFIEMNIDIKNIDSYSNGNSYGDDVVKIEGIARLFNYIDFIRYRIWYMKMKRIVRNNNQITKGD